MTNEKILISGGTGLIGSRLTTMLQEKGYKVAYLSRNPVTIPNIRVHYWDPALGKIEQEAIKDTAHIINLAGAGVADKRWTKKRKQVILDSRIESTALLREAIQNASQKPKSLISASAVGIYGFDTGDPLVTEETHPAQDFLADVTQQWEESSREAETLGVRTAQLRIGIVLSPDGGALPQILKPIKLGLGAALGSGKQYMSWIHIDDLCRMFIWLMENENLIGPYNGVAPNPVTNKELTRAAAKTLKKPLFLPNVPGFAIRLVFGEMGNIVLGGNRVSSEKIQKSGFKFNFSELSPALEDLLRH